MSDQYISHILELPSACLALLLQHTASGPGGLACAAALIQTCKQLHSLSESPAVTYSNIHVPGTIRSPAHQVWQWLAKRSGRVASLSLQLCVAIQKNGAAGIDELLKLTQHLQTLSGIPSVQLEVEWEGTIVDRDDLCLNQWLRQHGQIISHLTVQVLVTEDRLTLRDFAEAAASCRSIDLAILHDSSQAVKLGELAPLAGSLWSLRCKCNPYHDFGRLRGLSALNSLCQLTSLYVLHEELTNEQPWDYLAKLTNLKQLSLEVSANGDPSALSALTRLSSLYLHSRDASLAAPFTFSSLQPLSTLQQLQTLQLCSHACTATSFQGLAGLSNLQNMELMITGSGLGSLDGLGPGLAKLSIQGASELVSLAGIQGCSRLTSLALRCCGVSSLQPLRGLSSLEKLHLYECCVTSLEGLSGMLSTSLQSLGLYHCSSLISLSGIEQLKAMKRFAVVACGVTSLQPLSQLGEGLLELTVSECSRVQEVVLELPHIQPTTKVMLYASGVREVVLAGGVCRPMCGDTIAHW
jgi:hypothetical protein